MILDLTLPMVGWLLLAGVALTGAAVSALAGDGRRRARGLLCVVLSVTGLLMMLGLDLAALAWMGLGIVLVRLPGFAGRAPSATRLTSAARPARSARLLRYIAGLPAVMLGALLVRIVWSVDWRDQPPPPPAAGSAQIGTRLLTADLALLIGTGLLLVSVLAAAIWISRPPRSTHDRKGS